MLDNQKRLLNARIACVKRLSDEQRQALIADMAAGYDTFALMARIDGISMEQVAALKELMGIDQALIERRRATAWTALVENGKSVEEIAQEYMVHVRQVRRAVDLAKGKGPARKFGAPCDTDNLLETLKARESGRRGAGAKSQLNEEQIQLIVRGVQLGLSDVLIAAQVEGINSNHVFNFRKRNGITYEQVMVNRYTTWKKMLDANVRISNIAAWYAVSVQTIRKALWSKLNYSFRSDADRPDADEGAGNEPVSAYDWTPSAPLPTA